MSGQFYLSTKGLDYDVWLKAIEDGQEGDVLTLFSLSLLADVHIYAHLHAGQFWMTLKKVSKMHEEVVNMCQVHLLYLEQGLFVELKQRVVPLEVVTNPNPSVTSCVVGELTEMEEKTHNGILHTRLRVGHSTSLEKGNKEKKPPSASAGSALDLTRSNTEQQKSLLNMSPLNLSVSKKPVPAVPCTFLPLDLSTNNGIAENVNISMDDDLLKQDVKLEKQTATDYPLRPSPPPKLAG